MHVPVFSWLICGSTSAPGWSRLTLSLRGIGTAVKEVEQKSSPTAQQYAELSAAAEAHLRAAAALKGRILQ